MGYGSIDASDTADPGLYALPVLFITFRETLEAAIVVSVLLGLLDKLNAPEFKKFVWLGVIAASALYVSFGVFFIILVNGLKDSFLDDPDTAELVNGSIAVVASVVIAFVALSMGNIYTLQSKTEATLQLGIDSQVSISKTS